MGSGSFFLFLLSLSGHRPGPLIHSITVVWVLVGSEREQQQQRQQGTTRATTATTAATTAATTYSILASSVLCYRITSICSRQPDILQAPVRAKGWPRVWMLGPHIFFRCARAHSAVGGTNMLGIQQASRSDPCRTETRNR